MLASVYLDAHVEQPALPAQWPHMSAKFLWRILLEGMARVTGGQSPRIVQQWERSSGGLSDGVVAWPVWAPLARALAQGKWHADVTLRFRRGDVCLFWDAPVRPSERLLHFLLLCHATTLRLPSGPCLRTLWSAMVVVCNPFPLSASWTVCAWALASRVSVSLRQLCLLQPSSCAVTRLTRNPANET